MRGWIIGIIAASPATGVFTDAVACTAYEREVY